MQNCIQDIYDALNASPPQDVNSRFQIYIDDFHTLLGDLERAHHHFPPVYQKTVIEPFIDRLQSIGSENFSIIFSAEDDNSKSKQESIRSISLAILSYDSPHSTSVGALQEIISDLFDGFLSQEDGVSKENGEQISPPDRTVIPPLAYFGEEVFGPYIETMESIAPFGIATTVGSINPYFADKKFHRIFQSSILKHCPSMI